VEASTKAEVEPEEQLGSHVTPEPSLVLVIKNGSGVFWTKRRKSEAVRKIQKNLDSSRNPSNFFNGTSRSFSPSRSIDAEHDDQGSMTMSTLPKGARSSTKRVL